jgi:hypothetical protein
VTKIEEKKGQVGFLFGFMAAVLGFAAWRGSGGNALVIAALLGIGAVIFLIALILWIRRPTPFLAISPEQIWYGSEGQKGQKIERNESGRLQYIQGFRRSGWFLVLAEDREGAGLLMTGFDMNEVAAACVSHGWTFATD